MLSINTNQPKTIENLRIIDTKLVTIEHPKTYHKLSKTIRKAKKFSQVVGASKNYYSTIYSETIKPFFKKKTQT